MAKSKEINMNLPSADDLFTTREERDQKNQEYVKDISIYEITDFPNHPFKVKWMIRCWKLLKAFVTMAY